MICWCNKFCLSLAYISLSLLICARFLCKKESLDFIFMKVAHCFSEVLGACSYGSCCCCYLAARSCLALCDPMDSSPPGSSVHGISQARILGLVATFYSKVSSWPRDLTQVSCIESGFCTTEPPEKSHSCIITTSINLQCIFHISLIN